MHGGGGIGSSEIRFLPPASTYFLIIDDESSLHEVFRIEPSMGKLLPGHNTQVYFVWIFDEEQTIIPSLLFLAQATSKKLSQLFSYNYFPVSQVLIATFDVFLQLVVISCFNSSETAMPVANTVGKGKLRQTMFVAF